MNLEKEITEKCDKEILDFFNNEISKFERNLYKIMTCDFIGVFLHTLENNEQSISNIKKFITGKKSKLVKDQIDYFYYIKDDFKISCDTVKRITNKPFINNFFDEEESNIIDPIEQNTNLYITERIYEDIIPSYINSLWEYFNKIKLSITKENIFLKLNLDESCFDVKQFNKDIENNKNLTTSLKIIIDFINHLQDNIYESYFPQPTYSIVENMYNELYKKSIEEKCEIITNKFVQLCLGILNNNIYEDIKGFIKKRKNIEYHVFDGKIKVILFDITLEMLNILTNNWKNTKPESLFIFNEIIKIYNQMF